jgi:hypothetical protein
MPPDDLQSDLKALNSCAIMESNQNLTVAQKELLKWHCKLGHLDFNRIQNLIKSGELGFGPKISAASEVDLIKDPVLCGSCAFGKAKRRSATEKRRGKREAEAKPKEDEKLLSKDVLIPGEKVSMDHFIVSTPGRLFQSRGSESTDRMFKGGVIFVDHASTCVFVCPVVNFTAGEALRAKREFESDMASMGAVGTVGAVGAVGAVDGATATTTTKTRMDSDNDNNNNSNNRAAANDDEEEEKEEEDDDDVDDASTVPYDPFVNDHDDGEEEEGVMVRTRKRKASHSANRIIDNSNNNNKARSNAATRTNKKAKTKINNNNSNNRNGSPTTTSLPFPRQASAYEGSLGAIIVGVKEHFQDDLFLFLAHLHDHVNVRRSYTIKAYSQAWKLPRTTLGRLARTLTIEKEDNIWIQTWENNGMPLFNNLDNNSKNHHLLLLLPT